MHHRQTGKNYNVVLPFADFVLGRVAQRRPSDVRELLRLGHLSPRRAASVARIRRMRADHLAARNRQASASAVTAQPPVSAAEAEALFANDLMRDVVDGT